MPTRMVSRHRCTSSFEFGASTACSTSASLSLQTDRLERRQHLQDRKIGRAIALIHRDPARAWTLQSLASEVAMSRSSFAARFTRLVGEPVMQYLARWRMAVARTWLQEEDAALSDLAGKLGYQSEAAFSRAFKRIHGESPGRARRVAPRSTDRSEGQGSLLHPIARTVA